MIKDVVVFNRLEIDDIEAALTGYFGKNISISDVECEEDLWISCDVSGQEERKIYFIVDGKRVSARELWWNQDKNTYVVDGKLIGGIFASGTDEADFDESGHVRYSVEELPTQLIFDYNVLEPEFKSYKVTQRRKLAAKQKQNSFNTDQLISEIDLYLNRLRELENSVNKIKRDFDYGKVIAKQEALKREVKEKLSIEELNISEIDFEKDSDIFLKYLSENTNMMRNFLSLVNQYHAENNHDDLVNYAGKIAGEVDFWPSGSGGEEKKLFLHKEYKHLIALLCAAGHLPDVMGSSYEEEFYFSSDLQHKLISHDFRRHKLQDQLEMGKFSWLELGSVQKYGYATLKELEAKRYEIQGDIENGVFSWVNAKPKYKRKPLRSPEEIALNEEWAFFLAASALVESDEPVTANIIWGKLKISRAENLMNYMEKSGIVGPAYEDSTGTVYRDVLMSREEVFGKFAPRTLRTNLKVPRNVRDALEENISVQREIHQIQIAGVHFDKGLLENIRSIAVENRNCGLYDLVEHDRADIFRENPDLYDAFFTAKYG